MYAFNQIQINKLHSKILCRIARQLCCRESKNNWHRQQEQEFVTTIEKILLLK